MTATDAAPKRKPPVRLRPTTQEAAERESKLTELLTAARTDATRARRLLWAAFGVGVVAGVVVGWVAWGLA